MKKRLLSNILLAGLFVSSCLQAESPALKPSDEPTHPPSDEPTHPPSVIFIMADDLGWGDLGCYGAARIKTPACDRLAKEGMRFTDAHSPSAVCSPTRYALLTGRYAWRSWLKNWVLMENHPLLIEADRLTMGKIFQQAGYRTGCIGKWHLGWGTEMGVDFSGEVKPGVLETGFDEYFGVPFSHNSGPGLRVFMRDRRIVGLSEGKSWRDKEAQKLTMRSLEDTATELSKEAVAFIERHKNKPFFLYYPTTNIHFPLTPHPRYKGSTEAGTYGEFVSEFDWAVGEVLAALDRNGIADNTIVIVTSDNGGQPPGKLEGEASDSGHACNGPWRSTKCTSYEGGHRVPLLVRWPGKVKAGSVTDETVCLTDFFTTFAKLQGIVPPEDIAQDSFDLSPVLMGQEYAKPLRPFTIHHSVCGQFAIRVGDWKLIEGSGDGNFPRDEKGKVLVKSWDVIKDPESGKWAKLDYFDFKPDDKHQLFNLKEDPKEATNLAGKNPERVQEMLGLLNASRSRDQGSK